MTMSKSLPKSSRAKRASSSAPRVMTLHPDPEKQGTNIEKSKYVTMKAALLKVVPKTGPGVAFKDMKPLVRPHLSKSVFTPEVSITWYLVTVKLDLEARGVLLRVPGSRSQRLIRRGGR